MSTTTRILAIIVIIAGVILAGIFFLGHTDDVETPDTGEIGAAETYDGRDFSIQYPVEYEADPAYVYQALGPGKDITGVKFTIPAALADGTNLSSDSYVSVEELPMAETCSAALFLADGVIPNTVTEGGVRYSVASTNDAAAGNRYEEMVYAVQDSSPCIAVRYFIHYGAIQNYPEGQVQEFNKQTLIDAFDSIRSTLVIKR